MTFNVDFKDFYSGETNYVNVCDGQMLTNECVTNISDVKNVLNNSFASCKSENSHPTTSSYVTFECTDSPLNFDLNCNVVSHNILNHIDDLVSQNNVSLSQSNDFVSQNSVSTISRERVLPSENNTQAEQSGSLHANCVSTNPVSYIQEDPYRQLSNFCKKNSKKMIFSHMNINSLAPKFMEIQDILVKGFSDIFFISETKLDNSFPNAQFHIPSFSTHRIDRNAHGGGLLCYVKETIPHKNRPDIAINKDGIESLVIQVKDNSINNFFLHIYKPPNVNVNILNHAIECMLNMCFQESNNVFIIGDLNVNFLHHPNQLTQVCDNFDLRQIVKEPTCFKSVDNPSLLDIILTNCPRSITSSINLPLGISDFHNFISAATKIKRPSNEPRTINYRTMKNFNEDVYKQDLEIAPFHVSHIFDDVDDKMWFHNNLLANIIEKNAPMKQKTIKTKQLPYMNDQLRKAINVKANLRRKFHKIHNQQSWEKYRKQRNLVNKLKRKSLQKYFEENCNSDNNKGKHFWEIVKPFMTNKSKSSNEHITLYEGESLISNATDVCNIFNDYYVNVTSNFCEPENVNGMSVEQVIDHYQNHPSVKLIKDKNKTTQMFDFSHVTQTVTQNKLKQLKTNKASGFDKIPAKFLKMGADQLCFSLTPIINSTIDGNTYPDQTKRAEVTPLYKKSDNLAKENYRPLSILTSTSKIFEGIMCDQLLNFVSPLLSNELAAYRKTYSCNNVLVKCVENWRKSLDNNEHVGCILIDLSKAFDCLPHGLLIAKLNAYGVTKDSCKLILSYLRNRKQTVKIGNSRSEWLNLKTGVPQGSLFGPFLFNIFINDFILDLESVCDVYNYADDNTLSFSHENLDIVKNKLEDASLQAVRWFDANYMKANPSKFQAICISRSEINVNFQIGNHNINSEKVVKLLGVNIDEKLNFSHHVSTICKKAARQINALQRICKHLEYSSKLRIYESFIASNFEYCSLVYNSFSIGQDKKLEKLNERALRLLCNDYISTYENILSKTNKRMLYVTRKMKLAEFVFKVQHKKAPPLNDTFFKRQITPYHMRDNMKLMKPVYNTVQFGMKSIAYQGPLVWNSLPVDIKIIDDYHAFHVSLRNCNILNSCQCGNCILCKRNDL